MKSNHFARLLNLQEENDDHAALMSALRPRFARLADRHENGSAPRAVTAFQLFQTPAPLAARLVSLLGLAPGARVLEPSAGLGRLLAALASSPTPPASVVAVDVSASCTGELYRLRLPGVSILQRDFLTLSPDEIGTFDAVAMNPPFHMRADIRHIRHALTFLKPGGRCVALCLDTKERAAALRPIADTWEQLPAGIFRAEGTNVATVLASFTARP